MELQPVTTLASAYSSAIQQLLWRGSYTADEHWHSQYNTRIDSEGTEDDGRGQDAVLNAAQRTAGVGVLPITRPAFGASTATETRTTNEDESVDSDDGAVAWHDLPTPVIEFNGHDQEKIM